MFTQIPRQIARATAILVLLRGCTILGSSGVKNAYAEETIMFPEIVEQITAGSEFVLTDGLQSVPWRLGSSKEGTIYVEVGEELCKEQRESHAAKITLFTSSAVAGGWDGEQRRILIDGAYAVSTKSMCWGGSQFIVLGISSTGAMFEIAILQIATVGDTATLELVALEQLGASSAWIMTREGRQEGALIIRSDVEDIIYHYASSHWDRGTVNRSCISTMQPVWDSEQVGWSIIEHAWRSQCIRTNSLAQKSLPVIGNPISTDWYYCE